MKKLALIFLCLTLVLSLVACIPGTQGEQGAPGKDGIDGKDGVDGITPTIEISEDGYWVINGVKTEYKAIATDGKPGADGKPGVDGNDGEPGEDGVDGITPTIEISEDGYWVINGVKTVYKAVATDGKPGADGNDGKPGEDGVDGITPTFKLEGGEMWISYNNGEDWESLGIVVPDICQHRDADDNDLCDYCDESYTDGVDVPTDLECTHSFGAWIYYSCEQAYCEAALFYHICSECNGVEWRSGAESDHAYTTETTYPTCTEGGYDMSTCSVCAKTVISNETPAEHTYSAIYSFDSDNHWKECAYCDSVKDLGAHIANGDGRCAVCKVELLTATEGLIYEISNDGKYAKLVGYEGTATDIVIADTYEGLPVQQIYSYVFQNNDKITSVLIPDSVTVICESVFSGCTSLRKVNIPSSVTYIYGSAFGTCTSLEEVHITDLAAWCNVGFGNGGANPLWYGKNLYLNGEIVRDLVIPDGVTKLYPYAFYRHTGFTSVTIPGSISEIPKYGFTDCTGITKLTICKGVTTISSSAFSGCTGLLNVSISDSVINIGERAFSGCSSLVAVVIPDSVTTIGISVFSGCTAMQSVTIGNSVASINTEAFYNCDAPTVVTIPDNVVTVAKGAFRECSNLTDVVIGNGVTTIGTFAFADCAKLSSVTIGTSLSSIGSYAFQNSTALTRVNITDLVAWCNISFGDTYANPLYYAKNLYCNGELVTELVIPNGVTKLNKYAFINCTSITDVTIPDSVTTMENLVFYYCSNIKNVDLGNGLTAISARAFYYCTSLGNVTIPESVTEIASLAFYGCESLTEVVIPDSVTTIGASAFASCSNITTVIIGKGVTKIEQSAFDYPTKITAVYYNGTQEEWESISIVEYGNSWIVNPTRYYYSETEPTEEGNYWHYVDGVAVAW